MPLTINTNLSSLIVQSNLKQSTSGLNQAIERMTTGFKINGAKDNAANYSISTNMSTKIRAYQVAEDNASTGLDLLTTASDSLSLISDHLSRIRDLTTQAKNGTYGEESMKAINSEINARIDEIERLYSTTEFNGIKLFGGEMIEGSGSSTSSMSGFLKEVTKRDTSVMTTLASVDENTTISSGTYSISTAEELAKLATMTNNGKVWGGEFVLANDIDLSAYSTGEGWTPIGAGSREFSGKFDGNGYVIKNLYSNHINGTINTDNERIGLFGWLGSRSSVKNVGLENVNVTGVYYVGGLVGYLSGTIANCYATGKVTGDSTIGGLVGINWGATVTDSYSSINVTGKSRVGGHVGCLANGGVIKNCYALGSVIGNSDVGGLVGENFNSSGTITNSYYDKETSGLSSISILGISSAEIREKMLAAGWKGSSSGASGSTSSGTVQDILFQIGIHSNADSQIALNTSFALANLDELRNIGLADGNYLETIDNILASISAKQTEYGACQNRLESALEEINTHYENLVSSRSTLRDADVAQESSAYIRNQILQQASATLLATANQTPAIALQLL